MSGAGAQALAADEDAHEREGFPTGLQRQPAGGSVTYERGEVYSSVFGLLSHAFACL